MLPVGPPGPAFVLCPRVARFSVHPGEPEKGPLAEEACGHDLLRSIQGQEAVRGV